ncbi:hypothetical protein CRUP_008305 [Coryphaenoides rupestris]|nr:hypothetical protein CRUP_008305 [Coryphaenoides rupestris]
MQVYAHLVSCRRVQNPPACDLTTRLVSAAAAAAGARAAPARLPQALEAPALQELVLLLLAAFFEDLAAGLQLRAHPLAPRGQLGPPGAPEGLVPPASPPAPPLTSTVPAAAAAGAGCSRRSSVARSSLFRLNFSTSLASRLRFLRITTDASAFSETRWMLLRSREFWWAAVSWEPSSSRRHWGTRPNTPSESRRRNKHLTCGVLGRGQLQGSPQEEVQVVDEGHLVRTHQAVGHAAAARTRHAAWRVDRRNSLALDGKLKLTTLSSRGMSIPRAATSVTISTMALRCTNLPMLIFLAVWSRAL